MITNNISRTVALRVKTENNKNLLEFSFEHTKHSFSRANQRGITASKISVTIQYGEIIRKQGLIFYILGENNIPLSHSKEKSKFKNTVVIVSGDSNQLITCYRTDKPFKYLRQKTKRLNKQI
ncbi:MAG: hypothetical protein Q8K92_13415 [Leadbetterella sp.]|nr:hypothetical protein [Leadbetterella sp.]